MVTYLAAFIIVGVGLKYAPETSVKAWARREAIERQEERAAKAQLAAQKKQSQNQ